MNNLSSKSQNSSTVAVSNQFQGDTLNSGSFERLFENFSEAHLPYDEARSAQNTFASHFVNVDLDNNLVVQLKNIARTYETNLAVILLAAYQLLVFRWSGEADLVIGVKSNLLKNHQNDNPTLSKNHKAVNFVRSYLKDNISFVDLLKNTKEGYSNSAEVSSNQIKSLIDALGMEQINQRTPLLDIALEIQSIHPSDIREEKEAKSQLVTNPFDQHDILLTVNLVNDDVNLAIGYRTDIFESVTMIRFINRLNFLLEQIVASPAKALVDFEVLIPEERRLLSQWNQTDKDYQIEQCLHHLFELRAEEFKDNIALEFGEQSLTYAQLNSKANKLARYLSSKGVGVESRVGVCMERSVEMVVSLYAILKAGGGYVPLDPDYPQARLSYMLEDIEAPVILTQSHLRELLPNDSSCVIDILDEWSEIDKLPDHNLHVNTIPENLAYVIYTSGSTGNPKGVINQHNGIINRLLWMQDQYQLSDKDIVLQKTPYSFDVSVWEFFWPLIVGAKLVVAKPGGHQNVKYLQELIHHKSITTLHFVPSMLQMFIDHAEPCECLSIRQVFSSGEALPFNLQQQFFKFSRAKLHNLYGPTEAAVDVTYWQCDPNYNKPLVPIGRPVTNTKIHVLDKQLRPVPIGSPGELHIAGIQVARGYLNRTELTQEKFIENPFNDKPDSRLYKTGDLVRYLNDGQIEYIGRIDFQVKIRGLRIELGEIESKITEMASVKQCVVIVREDHPGDQKIVAYYQANNESLVDKQTLRKVLTECLPNYMIPHVFVEIKEFPLSPNGKIARKLLPPPEITDLDLNDDFVAPESKVEILLAAIWRELLGVEKISVYDKFIELGGHSLLALEAAFKAKELHQLDIDPASLIRDTLEQVAANIEGDNAIIRDNQGSRAEISYQPYYFGPNQELFGIYQPPRGNVKAKGAVLLCSPIYLESLNTHLTYRQLSARLSESGFHVFRFDYYASGDSLGEDQQADVERWLQDISFAKKELIKRSGFNQISMVGFRFGATLASIGLGQGIDKLVLWEPVVNGHTYAEQLLFKYQDTLEELNYIRKNKAKARKDEIIGFSFPEQTRISIEKANLVQADFLGECKKVIVITSNKQAEVLKYRDKLEQMAINIDFNCVDDSIEPIEGYKDLMVYLAGKSLGILVDKMKE
ncbi:MAG: amino acid adenylation domain-containing protein [Kangiellaceae bacterium]